MAKFYISIFIGFIVLYMLALVGFIVYMGLSAIHDVESMIAGIIITVVIMSMLGVFVTFTVADELGGRWPILKPLPLLLGIALIGAIVGKYIFYIRG